MTLWNANTFGAVNSHFLTRDRTFSLDMLLSPSCSVLLPPPRATFALAKQNFNGLSVVLMLILYFHDQNPAMINFKRNSSHFQATVL